MPPTPRKEGWHNLENHLEDKIIMNTPRKATLRIRECRYRGIPRYEIATQFLDRKDAEEIVYRVTMFEELVDKVRELANLIGGMEAGVISHPAGNTVDRAYELINRASQGGSKP